MTTHPFGKTTLEFLSYFRRLDVKLWLDSEQLRYSAPKGTLTPALRQALRERKAEICAFLRQAVEAESALDLRPIEPQPRNAELPLSFAQQRLWFLDQLGVAATYNMPAALRLSGPLNVTFLSQAITQVVQRHESLRTTFSTVNGDAVQVISPHPTVKLSIVELQSDSDKEAQVQRLAAEEARRPFDLGNGPLLRVTLLRLDASEHVLLVTMHHIVSDGWSIGVFIREVTTLYSAYHVADHAFSAQKEATPLLKAPLLPQLPIQYADFAHWQREWLQGEVLEKELTYWREQLAGAPPLFELPTDRPRPSVQTFRGGRERFDLSRELTQKLSALSQQFGATLFMTLLAAFKVLLYRYSGHSDLVVGTPIANRNQPETEALIGFFVNTLVLRTELTSDTTFGELLEQVRKVTLDAYAHQNVPFEKLVETLQPERNLSYSPLFQIMFVLQNAPIGKVELPSLTITPLETEHATPDVDLTLFMEETESGVSAEFEYNSDLFDAATIRRMAAHFETLLSAIVANPEQPVYKLPLLTAAERHQLLVTWNDSQVEYPADKCFHQLFEEQVAKHPEAIAVVFGEQQLTYRELNERANRLARVLVAQGVGPDTVPGKHGVVALLAERSADFLTAMIALFKAGGAYLPLNPRSPAKRIGQVLAQSQASLLLTTSHFAPLLSQALSECPPETEAKVLLIEALQQQARASFGGYYPNNGASENQNLPVRCTPNNLAYVIYTSGSTGVPKGAMVEHKGMLNHLYAKVWDLDLTSADIVAQTAPQSFDISVWQFLSALLAGGQVHILSDDVAADPARLLQEVEQEGISILEVVPSLLRMMLEEVTQGLRPNLSTLRWLIPTGEALPPNLCRQWFEHYPTIPMLNAYGPTECSDDVTHYPIYEPPVPSVLNMPIGRPVANMQMYILDPALQPVPIGVAGELYVGGVGVGRGYLNDPERTAPAFIRDPFTLENARLYKTGDKARYLPDGNIEFLGRLDYQVKIRGFRIELGEIEAVLAQHPAVLQTVIIDREEQPGNKRLVAYVIPPAAPVGAPSAGRQEVTPTQLRDFLKEKLPDYMVPSAFVILSKLPLTPNGKVDRRALPAPDMSRIGKEDFVAPRTPQEEVLAVIWAEVLGLLRAHVGIHDNFFELGGHSLLATQVASRIRRAFQIELPLRRLFESPTVAELSKYIEGARHQKPSLPQIEPRPKSLNGMDGMTNSQLALSFAQERLWFLAHFLDDLEGGGAAYYNMSATVRLVGTVNVAAFEQTLTEIVRRHEILRTTFPMVNGKARQVIAPAQPVSVPVVELGHLSKSEQEAYVQRLATEEARRLFDLANGPLLRVTLLRLSDKEHVLLRTIHHIVSDGWSEVIFIQEVAALYNAFCNNKPSPLPELDIQYADFGHWQRQWLSGELFPKQLSYWTKQLAGAPPLLNLPTDRPRRPMQSFRGASEYFVLNPELTEKVKTLSQRSSATLFMTLLAAFKTLLSRYSGQEDLVVGSLIANRNHNETEALIGFFVNALALRTDLSGHPTFGELLSRVRQVALDAYSHQDVPFEHVVEACQPSRDASHSPLFQVMFVLQNMPMGRAMEHLGLPELSPTLLEIEKATANEDLTLWMEETEEGLSGELEYNSDLFDAATIRRMATHFEILLETIVANPQQPIQQLPLLPDSERQQLLVEWNDSQLSYPAKSCFHQLFEEQVVKSPEAVAAVFGEQKLTYRELNERANRLARRLLARGVDPERGMPARPTIVALLANRDPDFLTAMIAIFKAGAAYLPLDLLSPPFRLGQILAQSETPFILAGSEFKPLLSQALQGLPEGSAPEALFLDELLSEPSGAKLPKEHASENLPLRGTPSDLAYVIYTSGSTGTPKGAMIEHKGMLNHLIAKIRDLKLTSADIVAQTARQSFDISVWQFLSALLVGGQVHIFSDDVAFDPTQLLFEVERQNISILEVVPSLLSIMLEEIAPSRTSSLLPDLPHLGSLRWLIPTGEALPPQLCRQWFESYPTIPMLNAYGPTECSDDVTHYPIYEPPAPEVLNMPIGRPVANTQLYILDQALQPVPIGVAGELYVGGVGVGRGYLNDPERTAQAFIRDPFTKYADQNARLYKTGDKARYLPDGNIEFLGRLDHQVKIRGFRIELGEIESVLAEHPAVLQSVVVVREEPDSRAGKQLVGYVVPKEEQELSPAEWRRYLANKLPDYMVPTAIVKLSAMPLLSSGKIDRRALPTPEISHTTQESDFVAPRTSTEESVSAIWADVLGFLRTHVGIHDNFFELGGHSLLAIQVISRLREAFSLQLPVHQLFELPTVARLAEHIDKSRSLVQQMQAPVTGQAEEREEIEL